MIGVLRIFALYALFFVGVLIRQQLWQNSNSVMVVQAFTSRSTSTIRSPMKHIISNQPPMMKLSVFYSSTKDKSDTTAVTYNSVESSIISALEMSLQQPSDVSNDQQQQDSLIVVKAPLNPLVVPIITTPSSSVEEESFPPENENALMNLPLSFDSTASTTDASMVTPDKQPPQSELNIWAARGLLLLVAAIWGTNFASVKYLENLCFHPPCHHPPSEAALARFGLAALVSIPLLLNQKWSVIRAGLECGLWISLGYFTQALALATIDAGQCAFICSLTVVFVPVAAAVLYNKPIKPYNLLAASIALAGVGVLEGMINVNALLGIAPAIAAAVPHTTADIVSTSLHTMPVVDSSVASAVSDMTTGPLVSIANMFGVNKGDILALGQPIGFGTAFLRIEQYQEQLKDEPNRILTIAAAQCVAVGIMAFCWVLYDFHGTIPNFGYMIEPHRIAAIGWTGIVTTVVAIFIEGIALQKASATDASLAFSTEPIWASLFGFILLHETLGINSYVGGALILTACLVGAVADLRISQQSPIGPSEE